MPDKDKKLSVSQERCALGNNLTLTFKILSNSRFFHDDEYESPEYNIDNLADTRFNVIVERQYRCAKLKILARKNTNRDSAVILTVTWDDTHTKNTQKFSEQWLVNEVWSEKDPGLVISWVEDNKYYLDILINVIASELIVMGLPLYKDNNFTDFRLSAADGTVSVHKASLAAHSDMFKTMLNGEWKETTEGRIEVEGASQKTLQDLKDFLYLGEMPNEREELQPLLQIAIRFFIESLKKLCIIKLAQNVKPEDYFQLLDYARENDIAELTCALLQLTPRKVIKSLCENIIKNKTCHVASNKE